ncbi:MarR family transcriptional regulator [Marinococcus halophilus]|uniref:MarR family transcriptional regulator n=1 Tax=Marinococcus halophilus TaxID=1371 RepID=A0A510Y4L9_MARHA|nr:MarR family transcriptional regulator [Marinococcus halophilus]OZT80224.1 MarR family transcriptional regulator [Marinococcus halophilus]GEK58280.1 MarR family transcriptional regulator [Marinococcus halophilus]
MHTEDFISIMIHQTDLKLTSFIKEELRVFNLTPEQNLIMMLLWEEDGRTQNDIARKLQKDKTNVARMASQLEKKQFVRRAAGTQDQRAVQLFMTDEGRELQEKVRPAAERFNAAVTKGISRNELTALEQTLAKINKNVSESLREE